MEGRIRKAVELWGISTEILYFDVQLLMLCSALEILTLKERGNIGYKLAERIAFLLKIKNKKRIEVFDEILELYEK